MRTLKTMKTLCLSICLAATLLAALVLVPAAALAVRRSAPAGDAGPTPEPTPTTLHIEAQTLEGEAPLPLRRAELLLVALGAERSVELPLEGASTELPLDPEWLCTAWPEHCRKVVRAFLFLEAENHVLLRSDGFPWPGVTHGADGPVEISFPRDHRVTVAPGGGRHELTVTLREPGSRTLRVASPTEGPLAGVPVEIWLYRTHLNECGELHGELLARGETDPEGRIPVPDGDFEYAFVFHRPHHIVRNPQSQWHPRRLITRLDRPETLVVLEELERQPLHMEVTDDGEPVSPIALYGCRSDCAGRKCGEPCCGPFTEVSDENGVIHIEDFRPLEWEKVYFVDPSGRPVWEGYPYTWKNDEGPIRVDLAGRWTGLEP